MTSGRRIDPRIVQGRRASFDGAGEGRVGARRRASSPLWIAAASIVVGAVAASAQETKPTSCAAPERTLSVDVVDLVAGRESAGRPELAVEHEGVTYLFTSPENKARFEKEPRAFEVADGGACGRMGPLSGLGDARRYLVHEGRVWFFASDPCRDAFRKNPSAFIERADAKPHPTAEQRAAGAAAMDSLVGWAGGADALQRLSTIRLRSARERTSGPTTHAWTWETTIAFPDRATVREAWDDAWFSTTRTGDGAAMASARGAERIAASRAAAFDRVLGRSPVMIVRAWADAGGTGRSAAGAPPSNGIVASGAGEGTIDGVPVRFVDVWMHGAASRFAIERSTGRPIRQSFRGREGGSRVAEVVRSFTAQATVDGITLPTAWKVTVDGKPVDDLAVSIDRFEVNPALGGDAFVVPAAVPAGTAK